MTNRSETYGLIITYNDGGHDHFKFPPQLETPTMASVIERLLGSAVLSLELEDTLLMIPTANIRSAELFPVPKNLPEVVLRKVERVPKTT